MLVYTNVRMLDPVSTSQQVAMARSERALRNERSERDELRSLTGADRTLLAAVYGADRVARLTPLAALWLARQRRSELFDRPVDARVLLDLHRSARERANEAERAELQDFARSALVVLDSAGAELPGDARALREAGGFSVYA